MFCECLNGKYQLILCLIVMIQLGCSYTQTTDVSTVPLVRDRLGYQEMMSSKLGDKGPIQNYYFMPIGPLNDPKHTFSGTLAIPESPMNTDPEKIRPGIINGKNTGLFPGVRIEFFTYKDFLVPVVRDVMEPQGSESFWQIIVSPGRVWSEAGDRGFSRASFPFALTNTFENETYNGIAMFLYNDTKVSFLRYQIVQQLTPYLLKSWFVAWGHYPVVYTPGTVKDNNKLAQEFALELEHRTPLRDYSELIDKYGPELLDNIDSSIDPKLVLTSGFIIDDVIYAKSCKSSYGQYPYLYEMSHGVWSVTKSMVGLMSMLRMSQKYGDDVFNLKIVDYLDVTAEHDGWDNVTFGDALNMATGIGSGSNKTNPNNIHDGYLVDQKEYNAWYLAPSAKEKLHHVFKNANHPWGPGINARYRDRDYFVLSGALDSFLKSKEGPNANLWYMMIEEVYKPIGIHHLPSNLTKEPDGRAGVHHMGHGLYITLDDIAKITRLIHNGGRHGNKQLLSATKLAEALYQTDKRGLPTGSSNKFGKNTYHMGLWHEPYMTDEGYTVSIPSMRGWGGISVILMPNGITGFRIGNGGHGGLEMTDAANRLRPFNLNISCGKLSAK